MQTLLNFRALLLHYPSTCRSAFCAMLCYCVSGARPTHQRKLKCFPAHATRRFTALRGACAAALLRLVRRLRGVVASGGITKSWVPGSGLSKKHSLALVLSTYFLYHHTLGRLPSCRQSLHCSERCSYGGCPWFPTHVSRP